jgi:uncharacterized protein with NAD-binding domain and iron-sulfur cluster
MTFGLQRLWQIKQVVLLFIFEVNFHFSLLLQVFQVIAHQRLIKVNKSVTVLVNSGLDNFEELLVSIVEQCWVIKVVILMLPICVTKVIH